MNLEENFNCPLCLQLAKFAVESSCCTKIFCQKCLEDAQKKFGHCPCCRAQPVTWHLSKIARKLISQIKVPCEYCQAKIQSGLMVGHLAKCQRVPVACSLCGEKMLQGSLPKHTATAHQKEAKDYLIAHALGLKSKIQNKTVLTERQQPANYFKVVKNKLGNKATLGDNSKYYCGGKLNGICKCCNGECGPDNGENCDACMELDVNRWKLDKGCLVNTAGYVCQVLQAQGIARVACFRVMSVAKVSLFSSQSKITDCRPGHPCENCTQMEYSLQIGRYTGLVS